MSDDQQNNFCFKKKKTEKKRISGLIVGLHVYISLAIFGYKMR